MNNIYYYNPINIGNPEEFTIADLAGFIMSKIGGKSKIKYEDLPLDDPKKRKPCIKKAREILGWNPTISLDEGLELTIKYFRDNMTA